MKGAIRRTIIEEYPEDFPDDYKEFIEQVFNDIESRVIAIKDQMHISDLSDLHKLEDVRTDLISLADDLY